MMTRHFCL